MQESDILTFLIAITRTAMICAKQAKASAGPARWSKRVPEVQSTNDALHRDRDDLEGQCRIQPVFPDLPPHRYIMQQSGGQLEADNAGDRGPAAQQGVKLAAVRLFHTTDGLCGIKHSQ